MPFGTEIVVQARHSEVRSLGKTHVGLEPYFVNAIAATTEQGAAARVIPGRFKAVPHLLDQGIDPEMARIASGASTGAAVGPGIQIVIYTTKGEDTGAHISAGNRPLIGLRVVPAEAFVVGKEIGFSSENVLLNDGAATSCAKPIV